MSLLLRDTSADPLGRIDIVAVKQTPSLQKLFSVLLVVLFPAMIIADVSGNSVVAVVLGASAIGCVLGVLGARRVRNAL